MTRRGFTLIEVVIACTLGALVLAASLGLLSFAASAARRTDDRVDAREAAHAALERFRLAVIDAIGLTPAPDGRSLQFATATASGELTWDEAQGRLTLKPPGRTAVDVLIAERVAAFHVSVGPPGMLRLALTIDRPRSPTRLDTLPPFTATDEIFVPCIGQRDPGIPWRPLLEYPRPAARPR